MNIIAIVWKSGAVVVKSVSLRTVVIGLILTPGLVLAHHSFRAQFDASQSIEVTGTVTKVELLNPHSYFYVDVEQEDSQVVHWEFELPSPNPLLRRGWKKSTLVPGDTVTVTAYPARKASNVANTQSIIRIRDGKEEAVWGGAPQQPE